MTNCFESGGVFESMRTYGGKVFRFDEHLDRLFESAKSAGLKKFPKRQEITLAIEKGLKQSKLKEAYIRAAVNRQGELELIVKSLRKYPKECYSKGVEIKTAASKRAAPNTVSPQIKSSDFLWGVSGKLETRGAFETVFLNNKGHVCEGSISNIFTVKDNEVFTPPCYSGCLRGVTRGIVMELAEGLRLNVIQEVLTRHELYTADEVFLANTTMEIMPVVEIDGRRIGEGRPGGITKRLMREFKFQITNSK